MGEISFQQYLWGNKTKLRSRLPQNVITILTDEKRNFSYG